ncbi:MAG: hypothetical protein LAO03_12565 [Acidobacteriia bacterium]|nr:hypothetical protein [Terriglobia bacterium]
MASDALDRQLTRLEDAKRRVGEIDPARLETLLVTLGRQHYRDALSLVRFHDALLFLRAFPPSARVQRRAVSLLNSFSRRVADLRKQGADLSLFDEEKYSGVAGTALCTDFHYDQVRWLLNRFPDRLDIDWDGYDRTGALAAALARFIPLLEEDSLVEADVPYRRWLQAASRGRELSWLVAACERLPLSREEKAEIFGALELPVRCELGNSSLTRTLGGRPVRTPYFHTRPFIRRNEVSLARELSLPPLKLKKLSRREGERVLDLCREATTARYRELYGTTRGDSNQVVQANVGRGVEIFLWGLPPERRLPLRAYQAGFTLKNGVPINYIEGIALFEWMEIGFNTFYAYRDGETAWIYAQVLRMLHQVLGVTCISVYPYQIGQDNEEAIQSGAFWFYRKLGFRPMRKELATLVTVEEKRIASRDSYRTSARTLRRLAQGHVVFELPGSPQGDWDGFAMRNLGFAVQQRMADRYRGDAVTMRQALGRWAARALGVRPAAWPARERRAFENYALVLGLIPDLPGWKIEEKTSLVEVILAKARAGDARYCRLLQGQTRLRAWLRKLGSTRAAAR